jgi:hypothetical protein
MQAHSQLNIVARARQFSSFILLVGTVEGLDRYLTKNPIEINNINRKERKCYVVINFLVLNQNMQQLFKIKMN